MTIDEIAKRAGVSPATVSRVMNNSARVRENTREQVMRVIDEMQYVPNLAAKNLGAKSQSDNIGLFVPDLNNPYFSAIVKSVTNAADAYHYNIFLFNTDESPDREHRFLRTVREQNLRGVIMIPISGDDRESAEHLVQLDRNGTPVVLVDRRIGNDTFDGVFTNDEEDAIRAVNALIAAGHTRIATVAGPQRSTPGYARLRGFVRAMEHAKIPVPEEYIQVGTFKFDRAYEAVNTLLELPEPPTAIFTSNNFSTFGALQSIAEHGLVIGKDISLLGFDEMEQWQWYPWFQQHSIGLSLVERPVQLIAEDAMQLLQDRLSDAAVSTPVKRTLLLSNQIVLRGSEALHR
jgi:LacI family transcriptional regulator